MYFDYVCHVLNKESTLFFWIGHLYNKFINSKERKMISGVIYLLSQTTILHKYNLIMQFNKKKWNTAANYQEQ